MLDPQIIFAGVLNGLLAGGIYVLVAVGLTLIYGVLHIINFAHGSLLMLAMYAVFFLWRLIGIDPYVALPVVIAGAFVFGFVLYRLVIGRFSHGRDENILLITLGLSIVIDNVALLFFGGDTQTIDVPYAGSFVELGAAFLPLPKIISFGASLLICAILGLYMASRKLVRPSRVTTSSDTPLSSGTFKVSGTRAGSVSVSSRPKRRAVSCAKAVAPILGIDRPPVASTSD